MSPLCLCACVSERENERNRTAMMIVFESLMILYSWCRSCFCGVFLGVIQNPNPSDIKFKKWLKVKKKKMLQVFKIDSYIFNRFLEGTSRQMILCKELLIIVTACFLNLDWNGHTVANDLQCAGVSCCDGPIPDNYAILVMKTMLPSHLSFWEMMIPRKLKDSAVVTVEPSSAAPNYGFMPL